MTDKESTAPTEQILIAYHADCIDGFTSAYIAHSALVGKDISIDLLPVTYTQESITELWAKLDEFEYAHLYIVDFSVPVDFLEVMQMVHDTHIIILDHHKTAFERYMWEGYPVTPDSYEEIVLHGADIFLNNRKSGAGMCWDFFMESNLPVPKLVQYVQDYDLWRFEFGDKTKHINKYLASQLQTLNNWGSIHRALDIPSPHDTIVDKGSRLQAVHDKMVESYVEMAKSVMLSGCTGSYVVCPKELTSDVGHALAMLHSTFGLTYDMPKYDDTTITFSLRGATDFDVSGLAKQFGGGGHKGAAGFTLAIDDSRAKEIMTYGYN